MSAFVLVLLRLVFDFISKQRNGRNGNGNAESAGARPVAEWREMIRQDLRSELQPFAVVLGRLAESLDRFDGTLREMNQTVIKLNARAEVLDRLRGAGKASGA